MHVHTYIHTSNENFEFEKFEEMSAFLSGGVEGGKSVDEVDEEEELAVVGKRRIG
jgi:hypothetical protein